MLQLHRNAASGSKRSGDLGVPVCIGEVWFRAEGLVVQGDWKGDQDPGLSSAPTYQLLGDKENLCFGIVNKGI